MVFTLIQIIHIGIFFLEKVCPIKPRTDCEEKENDGLAGWYDDENDDIRTEGKHLWALYIFLIWYK